jgi:hypothetical protein
MGDIVDYMVDWFFEEQEFEPEDQVPIPLRCKFCGAGNVDWTKRDGRWRLRDKESGELHSCAEYRSPRTS